jgi:hypothetical protein
MRTAAWIGPGDPTVYHLRVRRDPRPAPQTQFATADAAQCPVAMPGVSGLSAQSAIEACGLAHTEEFNAAVAAAVTVGRLTGVPEPFDTVPDQRVGDVAAVRGAASAIASDAQRTLRRRRLLLHTIAFLAAISFASFLKFRAHSWLLWLYLALLASAVTMRSLMRRQALHRRHLDYRCLSEGLRVVLFWRIAGVCRDTGLESSAVRLIGRQDASLNWIGSALSALDGWMGELPLLATFDGCRFAAEHWLGSQGGDGQPGQIPYYRRSARRLRGFATWLDRLVTVTLVTGVVSAAMLAVLPAAWLGPAAPILLAVMGFMPLVSGTASAAVDVPAQRELARQYECMADLFASAAQRFAAATSDEERRQLLFEVGTAALAEQRVWHAVFRQKPPESRIRA